VISKALKMRAVSVKEKGNLIVLALGAFVTYFVFGFYQQKIYDEAYYGEKFKFAASFVVLQCLVYSVVAAGEQFDTSDEFIRHRVCFCLWRENKHLR
jgi:quinol-cytochrome oxidoreductase complex cytochrome b subunit